MHNSQQDISRLVSEVFNRIGLTSPTVRQTELMQALLNHLMDQREFNFDARLSTRERNCLQLLAQGKSLEQIAAIMNIKRTTVATFIKRIKKKLDCDTLAQAVFKGMKH